MTEPTSTEAEAHDAAINKTAPPFFEVSLLTLVILPILTHDLYIAPWFYLHWDAIRDFSGRRFNISIRARVSIHLPFFLCLSPFDARLCFAACRPYRLHTSSQ